MFFSLKLALAFQIENTPPRWFFRLRDFAMKGFKDRKHDLLVLIIEFQNHSSIIENVETINALLISLFCHHLPSLGLPRGQSKKWSDKKKEEEVHPCIQEGGGLKMFILGPLRKSTSTMKKS